MHQTLNSTMWQSCPGHQNSCRKISIMLQNGNLKNLETSLPLETVAEPFTQTCTLTAKGWVNCYSLVKCFSIIWCWRERLLYNKYLISISSTCLRCHFGSWNVHSSQKVYHIFWCENCSCLIYAKRLEKWIKTLSG